MMTKATELKQFINTFSLDPLNNDNFDEFYVDTSEVRGDEMKRLEDTLLRGSYPYTKILFSSRAGTGATTELYNLAKKLKNRYEIINISALYDLDVYDMSYVDIVFEIMAATLLYYKDHMTELSSISEEDFSQLYNYWHSEHFITSLFVGYAEDFIKYETLSDGTIAILLISANAT